MWAGELDTIVREDCGEKAPGLSEGIVVSRQIREGGKALVSTGYTHTAHSQPATWRVLTTQEFPQNSLGRFTSQDEGRADGARSVGLLHTLEIGVRVRSGQCRLWHRDVII